MTVITPTAYTPPELLNRAIDFWQSLECQTHRMSPDEHDRVLARTSHLPHIVASALAAQTPEDLLPLAATGWQDSTRIAAGNPDLWLQILQENQTAVIEVLRQYADSLKAWCQALEESDFEQVRQLLIAGKQRRDSLGN